MRFRIKWKDLDKWYLCIPLLILVFVLIPISKGWIYGSEGDWLSQHLALAEQFRMIFYETGSLFPEYSWLGAGSNLYQFSYYGFLRPDVLLSFLFPDVEMYIFITGYAIFNRILAGVLFYYWLGEKGLSKEVRILGNLLFLFASCFWHSHHQIMFVNFLSWLILGLIMIDHLKTWKGVAGFVAAVVLTAFHSYFFLPGCVCVWTIYLIYCYGIWKRNLIFRYLSAGVLSAGISMILLLPTLLVLLEHTKDVKATETTEILSWNLDLSSFLYTPYGCGLTMIALFFLISGLWNRKQRWLCIVLLSVCMFQGFSYLLNGGLYVRDKALIPFLPLILYSVVIQLNNLRFFTRRQILLSGLFLLMPFCFQQTYRMWSFAEIVFGGIVLAVFWKTKQRRYLYLLCLPALILQIALEQSETFVAIETVKKEETLISEIDFSMESRMDFLNNPFDNANVQVQGNQKKVSMYSSSTNTSYNRYFFDVAENPVRIRNRVAMLPESNPFFLSAMGVRYITTDSGKVPAGYKILAEKGNTVLAENREVKPLLYGVTTFLDKKEFQNLTLPEKILSQYLYSITENSKGAACEEQIQEELDSYMEELTLHKTEKRVEQSKSTDLKLQIPQIEADEVLLLVFDVKNETNQDVEITINGIRNKLSGSSAPYPNKNQQFVYQISSNEGLTELQCRLSSGIYQIENTKAWKLQIPQSAHVVPDFIQTGGNQDVIAMATINMEKEGYLVTSLPIMNGYTLLVDGSERNIETVNSGFAGCRLEAGNHDIQIVFQAPGRDWGIGISVVSCLAFCIYIITERVKSEQE